MGSRLKIQGTLCDWIVFGVGESFLTFRINLKGHFCVRDALVDRVSTKSKFSSKIFLSFRFLVNLIDFWTSQNRFFSLNLFGQHQVVERNTNKAPISSAHFRELDISHPKGQFLNFGRYLASSVLFSDPKSHLTHNHWPSSNLHKFFELSQSIFSRRKIVTELNLISSFLDLIFRFLLM